MKKSGLKKNMLILAGRCTLILCAAYCAVGAVISAFDFTVSMSLLFFVVLLCSVAASVLSTLFRRKGILIMTVPALLPFMWSYAQIADEFRWIVYSITERYNEWTPVPVIFPEAAMYAHEPTVFFATLGVVLVLLLAATICLWSSTSLTMLVTLPLALITFVLTATQADVAYLLGLIAVYLTLLIGNAIHPDSYRKSAATFILLFALSVAFIGAIFLAIPPSRYERTDRMNTIRHYAENIAEQVVRLFSRSQIEIENAIAENSWVYTPDVGVWRFNTYRVNISNAGRRVITGQNLMEISVTHPGTFYLRGFSLDTFSAGSWNSSGARTLSGYEKIVQEMPAVIASAYVDLHSGLDIEEARLIQPPIPQAVGMNTRRVNDVTNVDYQPYYTGDDILFAGRGGHDGQSENLQEHEMRFFYIPGSVRDFAAAPDAMPLHIIADIEEKYTQIDESTASGLRELASEARIAGDPSADRAAIADAVAAYVMSAARYTLSPPTTPEGEDFALYFLQTSKEGYCIHFATAATLMLRSLGVPARFTSGYFASVSEVNTYVALTDRNAHAWVEVFYEDVGWVPLEVTPSAGGSGVPPPISHTSGEQTNSEPPSPTPDENGTLTLMPTPPQGEGESPQGQDTNPDPNADPNPSAETRKPLPGWVVNIFIFVGIIIGPVLVLKIRRHVLVKLRNRRFTQKNTNAAVISMWQYLKKISRGQTVLPTDIEELALKARFSQHRLTEEERGHVLKYARRLATELDSAKNEYSRIWFRYVRGHW